MSDRDVLMDALWECYLIAGGDPDGDDRWSCTAGEAARLAVDSVRQLRVDFDEGFADFGEAA